MAVDVIYKTKDLKDAMLRHRIEELASMLSLEYEGEIKIKVSKKEIDKSNLSYRWEKYLASFVCEEDNYLSYWSPNNGTHPLIQNNKILKSIVDRYYNSFERYQRVDMIEILKEYFATNFDFTLNEYIEYKAGSNEEIEEVLSFYMERCPYFRFDW